MMDLERLKALADAATRGNPLDVSDFIAAAREAVPDLVAEVELLRAEVVSLRNRVESGDIEEPWRREVERLQADAAAGDHLRGHLAAIVAAEQHRHKGTNERLSDACDRLDKVSAELNAFREGCVCPSCSSAWWAVEHAAKAHTEKMDAMSSRLTNAHRECDVASDRARIAVRDMVAMSADVERLRSLLRDAQTNVEIERQRAEHAEAWLDGQRAGSEVMGRERDAALAEVRQLRGKNWQMAEMLVDAANECQELSTGPAVPDGLWGIRQMLLTALSTGAVIVEGGE